jgi:hypothetical protein
MSALKDLEEYVDQTVSTFLEKMKEHEGENVDMGRWVQLFAFGTCTFPATYRATYPILGVKGFC